MPASDGPKPLRLLAPAKINLALEVLGRRPDGYHELDTVLTTIDLADELRLATHAGLDVRLAGAGGDEIDPAEELCGRAARALADAAARAPDARIEVTKRIPVAAGLGGGSSDAAAVLRGLNMLWELHWPVERLEEVATQLGSDVPFFLHGGTARCTGRGEIVEPLRDLRPLRLLVLLPPTAAPPGKTARRFGALVERDFGEGEHSRRTAQRIARGAPPPARDLVNAFEAVVERSDSELVAHYAAYGAAGARQLHLCGAGSAVYLFVTEDARVAELRRDFQDAGARVFEAHTLSRERALAVRRGADGA